jgi:hypothetical protein
MLHHLESAEDVAVRIFMHASGKHEVRIMINLTWERLSLFKDYACG